MPKEELVAELKDDNSLANVAGAHGTSEVAQIPGAKLKGAYELAPLLPALKIRDRHVVVQFTLDRKA